MITGPPYSQSFLCLRVGSMAAGAPGAMPGRCSAGFSGYCEPEPNGKTSRSAICPIRPVIAGSKWVPLERLRSAPAGICALTCGNAGTGSLRGLHQWHLRGGQKGGVGVERPSRAKGRRSCRLQTVLVFVSPSTLRVLRRMKSPLLKQLSPSVLSILDQNI